MTAFRAQEIRFVVIRDTILILLVHGDKAWAALARAKCLAPSAPRAAITARIFATVIHQLQRRQRS